MTIKSLALTCIFAASLFALSACATPVERNRDAGIKLYQQNQYDQALQSFDRALSYDEFDAQSNAYAGLIHYRTGNYEQASYHFKVALQSDPSSEQAKDGLTMTYIALGKPDEALNALERAAKVSEQIEDPRWKRTYINSRYQNQTEEGLFTGKAEDRLRIARTYEKLGDYDNAAVYYRKASEIAPHTAAILVAWANMYEKVGNKEKNREMLIRAYMLDPATPGLTDAMTRNNVPISAAIR